MGLPAQLRDKQYLYAEQQLTIPAGGRQDVVIFGEKLEIIESTAERIKVSIEGQAETDLSSNVSVSVPGGDAATSITFINDTGADVTLRFAYGINFQNNRLGISGGEPLNVKAGNTINSGAVSVLAAATQIVAANSNRTRLTLYNNSAVTIFVGATNAVTIANGLPVLAGGSLTIENGSAVYGIPASGTGHDLRYLEELV